MIRPRRPNGKKLDMGAITVRWHDACEGTWLDHSPHCHQAVTWRRVPHRLEVCVQSMELNFGSSLRAKRKRRFAVAVTVLVTVITSWFLTSDLSRPTGAAEREHLPSEEIYKKYCAQCHGLDGRARTAKGKRAGATDFTGDWNKDEARGIRIITKGKGEMPSFGRKLSADQIRSVWAYVQHF